MAEMKPPPPRYRIVERNGRLIVTDTWQEARPVLPDQPITPMAGTPKPSLPAISTAMPGAGAGGLLDSAGARLVFALCAGATDSAGNPILTTANFYDVEGPREIPLGPASVKRLGRWLLALVSALLAMAVLLYATSWGFVIVFVLAGMTASSANTTARPAITRWLDRL